MDEQNSYLASDPYDAEKGSNARLFGDLGVCLRSQGKAVEGIGRGVYLERHNGDVKNIYLPFWCSIPSLAVSAVGNRISTFIKDFENGSYSNWYIILDGPYWTTERTTELKQLVKSALEEDSAVKNTVHTSFYLFKDFCSIPEQNKHS